MAVDCISIGIDKLIASPKNIMRFSDLTFASSDAIYFAEAMQKYAYTIEDNLTIISDDPRSRVNPTRSEILKHFNDMGEKDSGNPLVIYFAGHGFEYNGNFYICPKDYIDEASHHTGISLSIALEMLSIRKNWILFIFDTCRVVNVKKKSTYQKMSQLHFNINEKTAVITSCSVGQYALELNTQDSLIGGIFTKYFITKLIDESLKTVSVYHLFDYAKHETKNFSKTLGYFQSPSIVGGDTNTFIL